MTDDDYDGLVDDAPFCEVCGDAKWMTDEYRTCDQCESVLCPRCYGHEEDDVVQGCRFCLRGELLIFT